MSSPNSAMLDRQVNRVNRRLFVQTLLNRLIWGISGGLFLGLVWFLAEPFLLENPAPWLRWTVVGSLAGVSTLAAVILAALRAPSKLTAALSLDEKFDLKERVTTSLSLSPQQQATPVGQALLEDVTQRVGQLDVGSRFPIRLSWIASIVPVTAALLALVAVFYEPPKSTAKPNPGNELKKPPVNKAEIDKKFNEMKKKVRDPEATDRPKSEKMREIEAEMEKIANRPRDTREQVRERIKEMNQVEEAIKQRQKDLNDKNSALKQQLKDINKEAQKSSPDGPANDMQKALAKGDMDKAKDEMDKLAKKLKDGDLSEKEREQLKNQLDNMKKKADDLVQKQKDKEDQLEKQIKEAKEKGLDADALERELDKLKQQGVKMKDLQDLAQKMGDCKDCMQKGDMQGAAEQLQAAAEKIKEMNLSDKEMKDLQDQLEKLQNAKEAGQKGDKGKGDGEGDGEGKDGDGDGKGDSDNPGKQGDGYSEGKSPGMDGPANGRRPKGKDQKTGSFDAKQKTDFDPKGQKLLDGFAPGQNFRAKSSPDIAGDVKQASQEAPEAIEAQRIPRGARDMAKGYFKNLGGQAEKNEKKPPENK
ncbi:MAG: hypothetical protein K2R98_12285 [Gemmataceae bacterium]|nr:hypothetical protein [Gemmataceae bacterium]